MDERTLAEIEAEMNDPDAWGEPEDQPAPHRRRSERRQRAAVVSVRLTGAELATVQQYAAERAMSLSGALRAATLEAAAAASKVTLDATAQGSARIVYPGRWHTQAANGNESGGVADATNFNFALAR